MSSTEGELDANEVATDDGGNASVRWTTTKTGSVIARLGRIRGEGAPLPFTYVASGFFDAKVTVTTSTARTATVARQITVTTP